MIRLCRTRINIIKRFAISQIVFQRSWVPPILWILYWDNALEYLTSIVLIFVLGVVWHLAYPIYTQVFAGISFWTFSAAGLADVVCFCVGNAISQVDWFMHINWWALGYRVRFERCLSTIHLWHRRHSRLLMCFENGNRYLLKLVRIAEQILISTTTIRVLFPFWLAFATAQLFQLAHCLVKTCFRFEIFDWHFRISCPFHSMFKLQRLNHRRRLLFNSLLQVELFVS